MWLPQLARQLATIDQMAEGRLTINIISSDMPGQSLDSEPRYRRTVEFMHGLRALLNGERLEIDGEFAQFDLDPPRIATVNPGCPPMYFGGFSEAPSSVLPKPPTCSSPGPTRSPRWVKPSPTCAAVPMRSGAN